MVVVCGAWFCHGWKWLSQSLSSPLLLLSKEGFAPLLLLLMVSRRHRVGLGREAAAEGARQRRMTRGAETEWWPAAFTTTTASVSLLLSPAMTVAKMMQGTHRSFDSRRRWWRCRLKMMMLMMVLYCCW